MEQESNYKEHSKLTENRKSDHVNICLNKDVKAKYVKTGFEDIYLIHKALPEIDLDEIDLETQFLKHRFSAPLFVTGITGGTYKAIKINSSIAQAVEELGLGMGVGSQRAAIENPKLARTYSIVRKKAPTAFIVANIGAPQIRSEYKIEQINDAVNTIEADALSLHLNPLQEAVQPEGDTNYSRILEKIAEIVDLLTVPLIVKETGAGISGGVARKLEDVGINSINIAGAGGTSWAAVEYHRAKMHGDIISAELGSLLWDWGIPTVTSLIEVSQSVKLPIIASGGLRSGSDICKALALGADLSGFAIPILGHSTRGSKAVKTAIENYMHQLKTIMFLVGARNTEELKVVPVIVSGNTADWLKIRGFNLEQYAKRGG